MNLQLGPSAESTGKRFKHFWDIKVIIFPLDELLNETSLAVQGKSKCCFHLFIGKYVTAWFSLQREQTDAVLFPWLDGLCGSWPYPLHSRGLLG
jgi:hypothetical protein